MWGTMKAGSYLGAETLRRIAAEGLVPPRPLQVLLTGDEEIGSLEAGKQADIAVIDGDNVRLSPSHNPIAVLVQYAVGTDVESVLVAGRLVVDGGEVTTIDQSSLLEEATALSGRLADVLEPRRYRPLASKAVFS